ncbi:MAG: hypothetical protein KC422_17380 [Trueperaceae bacterium]|nr:hypothetical protein [Trueperaceae bacterium]
MSLLAEIKQAAADVMTHAEQVKINHERLPDYARALLRQDFDAPFYDQTYHYLGDETETIAYLLCLDSINFGSGYFPFLKKRAGMSGYFTVASCLKDWFEKEVPSPFKLESISLSECTAIFGQSLEHPKVLELMQLFTQALNDLGHLLVQTYDASYSAMLGAANHSAEALMQILAQMPYFKDEAHYKGVRVPIYKRAQITPSDIALALPNQGLGFFNDLDDLTIFADNLVPHVLRVDGILDYSPELLSQLDHPIPAGSAVEVEIRCAAIHTVELMVAQLQSQGEKSSARVLDMLLWNRGLAQPYRDMSRHRTYTVFY